MSAVRHIFCSGDKMKTFVCNMGITLKGFTDIMFPQGSFVFSKLLREGNIKVDGKKVKANIPLYPGNEIKYYTTEREDAALTHYTLYEDDHIYVADKLSGVSCEGLENELKASGNYRLVHRIDRNTMGVLLFAKDDAAQKEMELAFRERRVDKYYVCVCANNFKKKKDVLKSYLLKDEKSATVKILSSNEPGSVAIETEYEVMENRGDTALVKVMLHTGKTHQIRAQMAYIGCPILGDEKYGSKYLNDKYNARRQKLVAKSVTLHTQGPLAYLDGVTFQSQRSI